MALGGGVENYQTMLADNGKLNGHIANLKGGAGEGNGRDSAKIDEDRKSDLEDFNEDGEEHMLMGGMGEDMDY